MDNVKNKKLNVLHVISGDQWAGAEVQVFQTLSDLQRSSDFAFTVVLFNDGLLNRKLLDSGITTIIFNEKSTNFFSMIIRMIALLHRIQPRIVHVHAYKEHILIAIATLFLFRRVSFVRTFHGKSEVPGFISSFQRIKSMIVLTVERFFLKNGRVTIVAVSQDLEKYLKELYPKANVVQIYNAIVIHQNYEIEKKVIRGKYGTDDDCYWIGTFARLAAPKNLGLLVTVATKLQSADFRFKISIFGEGPLKDQIQEQIDTAAMNHCIKLEGFCDDVLPVVKSMDLFILCSYHEGLPMSLLEAMAQGVPVISTNVGGIGEVIEDHKSGILVENNNADMIADAIIKVYHDNNLQKRLSRNAVETVQNRFSVDITNKKLISLYQALK